MAKNYLRELIVSNMISNKFQSFGATTLKDLSRRSCHAGIAGRLRLGERKFLVGFISEISWILVN